jgi:polysaccharide export outer membrane protein
VNAQGIYPIQRPTRTLSGMLAAAGGVAVEPEIAQITVVRGGHSGTVWYEDIFRTDTADIALRSGDRIFVEQDNRSFIALGATGQQNIVEFQDRSISALEAIASVGGLNPRAADPAGVFVLRNEPADMANAVLGRSDLVGPQRFVYVLDLTAPTGMFEARDFLIRDGDTVYVTSAPVTQWNNAVSALTGTLTSTAGLANQISSATE